MTAALKAVKRPDMGGFLKLLPYEEALGRIDEALSGIKIESEEVPVDLALGRISAKDVPSPCDIPAVSSSAMDGYALRSCELRDADASHPVVFRVKAKLTPSSKRPSSKLLGRDAFYVATGAPVPPGADAVVKVEEARPQGDQVLISSEVPKWKNIALRGEDVSVGSKIVRRGRMINAADIALLVAAGMESVEVTRRPKVGIISTGDELTSLGSGEKGKKTNNYSNLVAAYLVEAGATPVPLGVVKDDADDITRMIERTIGSLDALVTIGGSSVGSEDFTTKALENIGGCEELFHGVRLVPIKPTGAFIIGGKPVVLLPGHSVAAALAFFLVVRPIVNLKLGLPSDSGAAKIEARLSAEVVNPRPVGSIFLVRLNYSAGGYSAIPLRWGSNLVSSLAYANAYLRVPPRTTLEKSRAVEVVLLGVHELSRVLGGAES